MAKDNLANLQKALESGAKPREAPQSERPATTERAGSYKAPSRENKTPITAYLSPDYKTSLRLIQAKHGGKTVQGLMAEALNILFEHYGVPTVRDE